MSSDVDLQRWQGVGLQRVVVHGPHDHADEHHHHDRVDDNRVPLLLPPGTVFDNEYEQTGGGAQGTWNLTGHSRFDGRIEYIRRRYGSSQ